MTRSQHVLNSTIKNPVFWWWCTTMAVYHAPKAWSWKLYLEVPLVASWIIAGSWFIVEQMRKLYRGFRLYRVRRSMKAELENIDYWLQEAMRLTEAICMEENLYERSQLEEQRDLALVRYKDAMLVAAGLKKP